MRSATSCSARPGRAAVVTKACWKQPRRAQRARSGRNSCAVCWGHCWAVASAERSTLNKSHDLPRCCPLPCEAGKGAPQRGAGAPLAGMRPRRRACHASSYEAPRSFFRLRMLRSKVRVAREGALALAHHTRTWLPTFLLALSITFPATAETISIACSALGRELELCREGAQ